LEAGAKRVIITTPSKSVDLIVCMGVNEGLFDREQHFILANVSTMTSCLALVAKVLHEEFDIVTGFLSTVHPSTDAQSTEDASYRNLTRGRSAAASIVPATTRATIATTLVVPALEGKLHGLASGGPVPDGPIIDLVVHTEKPLTVEAVNDAFRSAAQTDGLHGILAVSEEPLVSADIIGCSYSALVDAQSTMALGDHTARVQAWYDNDWGHARRVVDLALYVSQRT
jgi:glyceraldehyde 3-phosphate dehydrogenase